MSSSTTPHVIIQGQEVTYPVCVRDASSGAATFLVNAGAARRLIPGDEVEVAEVIPGRALCSLAIIDYKDNDLGDYNEVSIAFFVRPRGESHGIPYLGNMLAMARGQARDLHPPPPGESVLHLRGGEPAMWGFPKTVQDITFDYEHDRASARLIYDGAHAMTLSVPRGGGEIDARERDDDLHLDRGHRPQDPLQLPGRQGFGVKLGGAKLTPGLRPPGR